MPKPLFTDTALLTCFDCDHKWTLTADEVHTNGPAANECPRCGFTDISLEWKE